jgi:hypothetical protein
MKTIPNFFRKTIFLALIAALAMTAFPIPSAYASGLKDPADPPAETTRPSGERLERIWARLGRVYERQGHRLERAGEVVERFQDLIDRMDDNEKDVTALQAALDAFDEALKEAHPIYESAKGVLNSHQGFDADGKVTDREKAVKAVKDLGEKLKEIREIVGEPGKALREAIRAFRNANRPADTSSVTG